MADILTKQYLLLVIKLYSCFFGDQTVHAGICEIARRKIATAMRGSSYDLEALKWQCIEAGKAIPEVPF